MISVSFFLDCEGGLFELDDYKSLTGRFIYCCLEVLGTQWKMSRGSICSIFFANPNQPISESGQVQRRVPNS
jgi:hypothetical protein